MSMIKQFIEARSDQWNATDFVGGPRTFTIENVKVAIGQDQPVSIKLAGEAKVWRCCKTTARLMVAAWGDDEAAWAGKSATLYCDPSVKWSGQEIGGIRISHMSHLDKPLKLALPLSRGKLTVFTVQPLRDAPKRAQPQREAPTQAEPEAPPAMSEADAIAAINATTTLADLQTAFTDLFRNHRATADLPSVKQAKDDRKAMLTPDLPPAEDDEIPL